MRDLAALACAVVLAGCATPEGSDSQLAAGEGVVLPRVVGNLEFPEWRSVRVSKDPSCPVCG